MVVAIIGILAAMLLPALGRARELAKRAKDMAHTKQIVLAGHVYASDNREKFPLEKFETNYLLGTSGDRIKYIDDDDIFECASGSGNFAIWNKEQVNESFSSASPYVKCSDYAWHKSEGVVVSYIGTHAEFFKQTSGNVTWTNVGG